MPEGEGQVAERRERREPERSLGRVLREAREGQQLSLEQIAADLRIEPRLLEALEQDRLADLGAPVFAKGYLKQYGQRLGLKYEDLLGVYYDQVEPQDMPIAPSRSIKLRDERQVTMWLIAGLALALLAVLLFVWWVNEPQGTGLFGRLPGREAAPAAKAPAATAPGAAAPAAAAPSSAGESKASASDSPPPKQPPRPAFRPQAAVAPNEGGPLGGTSAQGSSDSSPASAGGGTQALAGSASEPATNVASAASNETAGKIDIQLSFDADSWTEITDGDGERLYYGLAHAGAKSSFNAVPPVSVLLGNADAVHLRVDGHPHSIPKADRQGKVARFTLSRNASAD